jgi:hypothetical protein
MPTLTIPEAALPDLRNIADADQQFFDSLIAAIKETGPTLTGGQFERKIAERITPPDKTTLNAILRTSFFFYNLKEKAEVSAKELGEAVATSPIVANSSEFSEENRKRLQDRLVLLLSLDHSLGVTSKAVDVMTEHERTFCSARIISDIRPVFTDDPEEASGAVVIHNLQIGYHQGGEHHECYFALDSDDISELKKVIDRAEKKTVALVSILRKSGVPYLKP